jgi:hypothetical protein
MNFILAGNFLIYLFLCASTEEHVASSYELLRQYHDSLRLLSDLSDPINMGLFRPALLRAESFFQEAVQVMRVGTRNHGGVTNAHIS